MTDTLGELKGEFVLKKLKNQARLDRFAAEIQATQRLQHPNILKIVDYDLDASPPYYVSERCENGSLEQYGAAAFKGNIDLTAQILVPVLKAVQTAHGAKIVHRDIKPANILVRADGSPVLADFGICFLDHGSGITESEEAVGSRNFIAPEMESGSRLGDPTPSVDTYCLGKVLYWMLSGGRQLARENHRSNPLPDGQKDQRFEHVHELLDRVLLQDPGVRIALTEFDNQFQIAVRRIMSDATPLKPSIGLQCRFCKEGSYARLVGEWSYDKSKMVNGQKPEILGLGPAQEAFHLRVLRCGNCGHMEWFYFSDQKAGNWWHN